MIVTVRDSARDDAIVRWHSMPDRDALQRAALSLIANAADDAIRQRGAFAIVLAGGNTPRPIYRMLRDIETDWSRWEVFFGDERCMPPDDPERNSYMVRDVWLDQVPIPSAQRHVPRAELGAEAAARDYAGVLRGVDAFDLVLLGLGEDGHTASLFPGHELGSGEDAPDVLPVFDAPKPPPERITLSAARLARARSVLFLVEGESKRDAVTRWRLGADIPARAIRPRAGVDVLVDAALLA